MAKLSKKEQETLDALKAKMEAPDAPTVGRSLSASIDLGNPEQVKLAKKYGFLPDDDDDDDGDGDGDGDDDGKDKDDTPKRRGYFGDS